MAEAGELRERMARMLECPICMCQFASPKVLPCQHTYCRGCLVKLQTDKPTIKCPSCRRRHTISKQYGVDGFPPNVTIEELLALQNQPSGSGAEDEAEEKNCSDKEFSEAMALLENSCRYLKGTHGSSNGDTVITMRKDAVIEEIERAFRGYQEMLNSRERSLKAKVASIAEADKRKRDEWQDKVKAKLREADKLKATFASVNLACQQTDSESTVNLAAMTQQAKTLSSQLVQVATAMPLTSQYHFTFGSQILRTHITTYGSIVKDAPVQDSRRPPALRASVSIINEVPDSRPIAVDYYPSQEPLHVSEVRRNNQDRADFTPFGLATTPAGQLLATDLENHRVVVFGRKLETIAQFGRLGGGDGELNRPTGIASDPEGNIFVADQLNNRIQVFDGSSDFEYRYQFGERGSEPGKFHYPCGLAIGKNARLFVCDSGNFRVQILSTDGTPLSALGNRELFVHQPMHLTITTTGKVIVTDLKQYIRVFDGNKEQHKVYMSQPSGVVVDHHESLIVGDTSGRLVVLRETGEALCHVGSCGKALGQLIEPRGLVITQDDNIAVADSAAHRVQVFKIEALHDVQEV